MHPMHVESCDLNETVGEQRRNFITVSDAMKSSQAKSVAAPIRGFAVAAAAPKFENAVSTTKSEGGSSKEARFQCGYCDKSFATPSKVKRHILTHTGEKPFVCQFCSRGFSQKVHMMEHITKHHAEESLKAQQEAAANAAAAAAESMANIPTPPVIQQPKSTTFAAQTLKSITYASQTLTSAPILNTSQTDIKQLAAQAITATQVVADSSKVQFPIPENSYIIAEFSLNPADSHISPETAAETAEVVQEAAKETTEIMATININQHSPLAAANYGLARSPASPYQQVSQSGFASPASAATERPFVCTHCTADFIRQSNLSVHMMKVHGESVEVRTHQCSYCEKTFKYPNKKRLHEMTHTGEKPNVCQFCSMGFFKKSRLRVHLTKHHGIPESEVNAPNSRYLAPPPSANNASTTNFYIPPKQQPAQQQQQQQTTVIQQQQQQQQVSNGAGGFFCQYCQKPFSSKIELLTHERHEAMEFEQLHEMFEDNELTGLAVGNGAQPDIIQNALLTAGIENGLASPGHTVSVTESDSVVTISEDDIGSFAIGFIPDASWSNEVASTLAQTGTTSTDPFYPVPQTIELSQTNESQINQVATQTDLDTSSSIVGQADPLSLGQPLKTESNPYPNMSGEINQLWDTTVAQTTVAQNISSVPNSIKAEPLLASAESFTSTTPFNGIYTENTYTITNPGGALQDATIQASIINLHDQSFTNGGELDFGHQGADFATAPQNYIELDGLTTTYQQVPTTTVVAQAALPAQALSSITWVDDPTLPAGWKTRQHIRDGSPNKIDTYYMSPDGKQFRSKWKIVEYMEAAAGTYTQDEIQWVRNSITTPKPPEPSPASSSQKSQKERADKREWKDDDPTVPKGWKIAWTTTSDNRSKLAFMSPDKKIFHSRKAALQHMVQAGTYDPEDIVTMTKGLNVLLNVGKEWKEGDKSLPKGWKIRSHQWWCQKRNSHRIHYEFLSPQNEFFKSRKAVVEHMGKSAVYTQEEIDLVKAQTVVKTDEKNAKKKAAVTPSKMDLSPLNPLIGWKLGNNTLPPGWKIKRHEYANQTVYFYMSPKGDICKSRRAVMDYMFKDGSYTEKDFGAVINGAKQRKVALQELYDTKTNKKRKRRARKSRGEEEEDEEEGEYEIKLEDNPELKKLCDLEDVDFEDLEFEEKVQTTKSEPKKSHKRQPKVEKEPPLPTRRSRRFAAKMEELEKQRKRDGSTDQEDEDVVAARKNNRLSSTDTTDSLSMEQPKKRPRKGKGEESEASLSSLADTADSPALADIAASVLTEDGLSLRPDVKAEAGDAVVKTEEGTQPAIITKLQADLLLANTHEERPEMVELSVGDLVIKNAPAAGGEIPVDVRQPQTAPYSIHSMQTESSSVQVVGVLQTELSDDSVATSETLDSSETNSKDHVNISSHAMVVDVLSDIVSSISG